MNRLDVCNLIVSTVNATARRYSSLKSETPLAKKYLRLHGSAENLSSSIPGLNTEQLEKKYIALDKKFIAIEQEYKDMDALGLLELTYQHYASNPVDNEVKMKDVTKINTPGIQIKLPDQEGQATFKLSRGGERAGAGRKKKEGMETRKISLSLPVDWWQTIDEMKDQHKMTQSDVLHNLIIPILAITSGGYNTDFIKSEGAVMTVIEKYFGK
jgi:hypothetical protein